jgi:hypothetical protein
MAPRALDSAGRLQFWKQSYQHALSLTNRPSPTQAVKNFGVVSSVKLHML